MLITIDPCCEAGNLFHNTLGTAAGNDQTIQALKNRCWCVTIAAAQLTGLASVTADGGEQEGAIGAVSTDPPSTPLPAPCSTGC